MYGHTTTRYHPSSRNRSGRMPFTSSQRALRDLELDADMAEISISISDRTSVKGTPCTSSLMMISEPNPM